MPVKSQIHCAYISTAKPWLVLIPTVQIPQGKLFIHVQYWTLHSRCSKELLTLQVDQNGYNLYHFALQFMPKLVSSVSL